MGACKRLILFLLGVAFGIAVAVFFFWGAREPMTGRRVFTDTVHAVLPVARESLVIRYRRVTLPVPSDSVRQSPGVSRPDSARVEVPITQTVYRDSDYTAYVSGYAARLDSLTLLRRREERIINPPDLSPQRRRKRWGVGIQAGTGISCGKQTDFAPYIGIGISYNLFTF